LAASVAIAPLMPDGLLFEPIFNLDAKDRPVRCQKGFPFPDGLLRTMTGVPLKMRGFHPPELF
jgi:hypothetical protein